MTTILTIDLINTGNKSEVISNLGVHDCTPHEGDAEEGGAGVLKDLDLPVVVDKEDGDEAAHGAEYRDAEQDQSGEKKSFFTFLISINIPVFLQTNVNFKLDRSSKKLISWMELNHNEFVVLQ